VCFFLTRLKLGRRADCGPVLARMEFGDLVLDEDALIIKFEK